MADQPQRRSQPPAGRENRSRLIVALVIAAVILVFAFQNTNHVRVSFLFFHWDARVIYLIIVSALLGALAAYLVGRLRRSRRREERRD
ncbi:MAG TPA: lipopolysaccharide assembly protein LapA domain-containing protein [Acidimicrobiia bacterium]|nr:lipopolysaccharide assembly protein LapA domain-containing protein [Acidimicrobiia bacterium]